MDMVDRLVSNEIVRSTTKFHAFELIHDIGMIQQKLATAARLVDEAHSLVKHYRLGVDAKKLAVCVDTIDEAYDYLVDKWAGHIKHRDKEV